MLALGNGKFATVDPEDLVFCSLYCEWKIGKGGFVTGKHGSLHLIIAERMGLQGYPEHLDGNKLNNSRRNLGTKVSCTDVEKLRLDHNQKQLAKYHQFDQDQKHHRREYQREYTKRPEVMKKRNLMYKLQSNKDKLEELAGLYSKLKEATDPKSRSNIEALIRFAKKRLAPRGKRFGVLLTKHRKFKVKLSNGTYVGTFSSFEEALNKYWEIYLLTGSKGKRPESPIMDLKQLKETVLEYFEKRKVPWEGKRIVSKFREIIEFDGTFCIQVYDGQVYIETEFPTLLDAEEEYQHLVDLFWMERWYIPKAK